MGKLIGFPGWKQLGAWGVLAVLSACESADFYGAGVSHVHLDEEAVDNGALGIVIYDVNLKINGKQNHIFQAPYQVWGARRDMGLPKKTNDIYFRVCFPSYIKETDNGYGFRYFVLDPGYYMLTASSSRSVSRHFFHTNPLQQIGFDVKAGEVIYIGTMEYRYQINKDRDFNFSIIIDDNFDEAGDFFNKTFSSSNRPLEKRLMKYMKIEPPPNFFGVQPDFYSRDTVCMPP